MRERIAGLLPRAAELAAELPATSAAQVAAPHGAEIVIEGVVGLDVTAADVRAALRRVPADAPLTVRVNSPGGLVTEGFAIFNLLAQRPGPLTARVDGLAASAASYIVMAASRIEMARASLMMIHEARVLTLGTKGDHEASAEYLAKIDAIMARIYAARSGRPEDEIVAMMAAETWFDGPEAVAAGFADTLVEGAPVAAAPLSAEARALLAGFRAPPARIAALALSTSNPPPQAAPPPKEVRMDHTENTSGGAAAADDTAAAGAAPAAAAAAAMTQSPAAATAAELAAIARKASLGVEWIEAQSGATLAQAQAAALDAIAARAQAAVRPSTVVVTRDEGDTRRRAIAAALDLRAGVRVPDAEAQMAGEMRGWSLIDFARHAVQAAGGNANAAPVTIARAALGMRQAMASVGMHTTSDFPNLLANTAAKTLRAGYDSAPRTFTAFARQTTLPDFKTISRVALGGAPQLTAVSENGEIEMGSIGEGAESYRVFRVGRRVAITFEAIVNDDLSGFSRVPQMFGAAASRYESDTVWAIFNANPNMADGVALFHATHSNVGTGALSVASLGAGRVAMRKQTAPNGDTLNLQPRYLIVPAELETQAASLLVSTVVPAQAGTAAVNPWAGSLTLVPEPRLTSATQWYLAADPAQIDTIEYAYLAGLEGPQVSSYTEEATDGVVVKCTHCFGAKAIDWRGLYRSSGV